MSNLPKKKNKYVILGDVATSQPFLKKSCRLNAKTVLYKILIPALLGYSIAALWPF